MTRGKPHSVHEMIDRTKDTIVLSYDDGKIITTIAKSWIRYTELDSEYLRIYLDPIGEKPLFKIFHVSRESYEKLNRIF